MRTPTKSWSFANDFWEHQQKVEHLLTTFENTNRMLKILQSLRLIQRHMFSMICFQVGQESKKINDVILFSSKNAPKTRKLKSTCFLRVYVFLIRQPFSNVHISTHKITKVNSDTQINWNWSEFSISSLEFKRNKVQTELWNVSESKNTYLGPKNEVSGKFEMTYIIEHIIWQFLQVRDPVSLI